MRVTASLFAGLLLVAASAFAQSSDGIMPYTFGIACDMEPGATAAGLCKEYCVEMSCQYANDDDRATEPSASKKECKKVEERFKDLTQRVRDRSAFLWGIVAPLGLAAIFSLLFGPVTSFEASFAVAFIKHAISGYPVHDLRINAGAQRRRESDSRVRGLYCDA